MYGAVLRPRTELTESGEAHMGVLFLTNEGYSTMCGHATLALGRLLVDQAGAWDSEAFPLDALGNLKNLTFDSERNEVLLRLHAPCGVVHVTVPALPTAYGRWRTDTSRPISYLSVPSYATGISVNLNIPPRSTFRWDELANSVASHDGVVVDIAYGGAFYIIVSAHALGFGSLIDANFRALGEATRKLKAFFNRAEAAPFPAKYLRHPEHEVLQFLYGVIVTDDDDEAGAETGLCFFADQQVDRSPTGSGVQARVSLAFAKGERELGERRTYHSPVSRHFSEGAFVGEAVEAVDLGKGIRGVIVKVSGWARYTGCCNFVIEDSDKIGEGFWFDELKVEGD